MRKAVYLVAAAVLSLGLLGGCSSKSEEGSGNSAATGPSLDGTFDIAGDTWTNVNGEPDTSPPVADTYAFRSSCAGDRCVAVGVAVPKEGKETPQPSTRVFDFVDGKWSWIGVVDSKTVCKPPGGDQSFPGRMWKRWSLDPQPDGSLTGTVDNLSIANECRAISQTNIRLTKVADAPNIDIPDPAAQPAPVISAAAALHGHYTRTSTDMDTGATDSLKATVSTECVRTGDTCAARVAVDKEPGKENEPLKFEALTFADGKWSQTYVTQAPCPQGGASTRTITATYPLPDPSSDPITTIDGTQLYEFDPGCTTAQHFRTVFQRIGD